MKDHLMLMLKYKAWADELFLSCLSELPHDVLLKEQSIVFGNILNTVNHVHRIDVIWQKQLLGVDHGFKTKTPSSPQTIEQLIPQFLKINLWYQGFLSQSQVSDLDQILQFRFLNGQEGAMSRAGILLHVINHATYHRGHVADMLYGAGCVPPVTDLPVFLANYKV